MAPPKPLLAPLVLLVLLLACGAAAGAGGRVAKKQAAATSAAAASSSNDWCFPGLECPRYDLLEVAGAYQVRKYEPTAWAVTVVRHAPSLQASQLVGLARLAKYWKGGNDRGRTLPPTAPLLTALFPATGKGGDGGDNDAWSAKGVFVVAAPLPIGEAHYPPRPLRQQACPWGDPDGGGRGGDRCCRVRVLRSGVEGGCRNDEDGDGNDGDGDEGDDCGAWLSEAFEALKGVVGDDSGGDSGGDTPVSPPDAAAQGGGDDGDGDGDGDGDNEEGEDDPPCFLDGPNGYCSEVEDEDEGEGDDPYRRHKRRRRHRRDKGTVAFASEPFDGFLTERDALSRARALRLALHADHRPYCRRVFFLAAYSPPWQLVLRRNEVWVPSCARSRRNEGGADGDGEAQPLQVAAS